MKGDALRDLLLVGSPCVATTATVAAVVALDYFRAPPESASMVVAVFILGGVAAAGGAAAGALRMRAALRWRVAAAILAGLLSAAVYCVASVFLSYAAVAMIAQTETGKYIDR